MSPQDKLIDDIQGILYDNKSGEADDGSWIEGKDFHKVSLLIAERLAPPVPNDLYEAAKQVIANSGNKRQELGNGRYSISFSTDWLPRNIAAWGQSLLDAQAKQLSDENRALKAIIQSASEHLYNGTPTGAVKEVWPLIKVISETSKILSREPEF